MRLSKQIAKKLAVKPTTMIFRAEDLIQLHLSEETRKSARMKRDRRRFNQFWTIPNKTFPRNETRIRIIRADFRVLEVPFVESIDVSAHTRLVWFLFRCVPRTFTPKFLWQFLLSFINFPDCFHRFVCVGRLTLLPPRHPRRCLSLNYTNTNETLILSPLNLPCSDAIYRDDPKTTCA
jgi:hypothetical protein